MCADRGNNRTVVLGQVWEGLARAAMDLVALSVDVFISLAAVLLSANLIVHKSRTLSTFTARPVVVSHCVGVVDCGSRYAHVKKRVHAYSCALEVAA